MDVKGCWKSDLPTPSRRFWMNLKIYRFADGYPKYLIPAMYGQGFYWNLHYMTPQGLFSGLTNHSARRCPWPGSFRAFWSPATGWRRSLPPARSGSPAPGWCKKRSGSRQNESLHPPRCWWTAEAAASRFSCIHNRCRWGARGHITPRNA